ncbi:MAG: CVNH domain-containing protein [Candidatus Angelobacter sp.]
MPAKSILKVASPSFVVFALLALFPSGAQAQPKGSYWQTCSAVTFQADTLSAKCRTHDGKFRQSSMGNISTCVGDIFNDDGWLKCSRGAVPPPGSYTRTCEMERGAGPGYLTAVCRKHDGNRLRTTLSYNSCVGDIFNDDGVLRCSTAALPPGSYTQSCDRLYVSGGDLKAFCRNRDGNPVSTALHSYRNCIGDIHNDNGSLWCSFSAPPPPSGSYSQSCQQTSIQGEALLSFCKDRGGSIQKTSLPKFRQCVGDIFNDNGNLGCRR